MHPDAIYACDAGADGCQRVSLPLRVWGVEVPLDSIRPIPPPEAQLVRLLNHPAARVLGTEIVDGQKATMVIVDKEALDAYLPGLPDLITKPKPYLSREPKKPPTISTSWFSNEHGLILKGVSEFPQWRDAPRQVATDAYEYVFGDIPDSVFEVPREGIQEYRIPENWQP